MLFFVVNFFYFFELELKSGSGRKYKKFFRVRSFYFFELGKFKGLHFQKYKNFFKPEAGNLCFLKYKRNFFSENITKFLLLGLETLFSIRVFFHDHPRITGLQGKGEGISLTPRYHFHPLHRHLDISRAITAESSPLHIASSWVRTGNVWFPSERMSPRNFFAVNFFLFFQARA